MGHERGIGPVSFRDSDEHPFLGQQMGEVRDHSEHTAQLIDEEVQPASSARRTSGPIERLAPKSIATTSTA